MVKTVLIETKRTRSGYARAELHRFMNYSTGKVDYSFNFYNTCKFFNTYKEMQDYVESNYKMRDWEGKEYHLPDNMRAFFN